MSGRTECADLSENCCGMINTEDCVSADQGAAEEKSAPCPACGHRTKKRTEKEFRDLMNRLKRVEGQVRGVEKMLEEGAYCPDIMIQVSAINCALNSFNKVLLASHMKSCVTEDIQAGKGDEAIDELAALLQKVMK